MRGQDDKFHVPRSWSQTALIVFEIDEMKSGEIGSGSLLMEKIVWWD